MSSTDLTNDVRLSSALNLTARSKPRFVQLLNDSFVIGWRNCYAYRDRSIG
ncbi:MAG: hypothetical protein M9909_05175 [Thermomicrobiales bacterium]|nr:hypothetical protein [Thermomicrobiales bacterium]